MSTHTAGPWAVNPVLAQVNAMPSRNPVCALLWPTKVRSEAETEANARLIASAPELLAALTAIVLSLADHDDEGMIEHAEQMIAARAAIAKATQP